MSGRDIVEKSPGGERSAFERDLFRGGTLDFNRDYYEAAVGQALRDSRNWYDSKPDRDDERTAEIMVRCINDARREEVWRCRFSGRVPGHWHIWYNVMEDFKEARRLGVCLSEILVDAGVTYYHHAVAAEVGMGQRLTVEQLAWLLTRPDFQTWKGEEIVIAQREKGATEEEISKARRTAEQWREKMEKYRDRELLERGGR